MAERKVSGSSTDDECEIPPPNQEVREIQKSSDPLEGNEDNQTAHDKSQQSAQATTSAESAGTGKKENPDSSNTALGSLPTPSTSEASRTVGRSSESGRGSFWIQTARRFPAASQFIMDLMEVGRTSQFFLSLICLIACFFLHLIIHFFKWLYDFLDSPSGKENRR